MRITEHANQRIKERVGLNKKARTRHTKLALKRGMKHIEAPAPLKKYLNTLFLRYNSGNNMRVYNHKVFIFQGETLITVLNLPNEFKKYVMRRKSGSL